MADLEAKARQWREEGYCVISGLIEPGLMKSCTELFHKRWDTIDKCCRDFGSVNGEFEFPNGQITDYLSIDENVISFVKKLLSTEEITLIQSDAWSKAGRPESESDGSNDAGGDITQAYNGGSRSKKYNNQDQRMHMDYGNNTFLHPGDWHKPDVVAAILYFHDTEMTQGGTAVVPRNGDDDPLYQQPYLNMPGYRGLKYINNKAAAEEYFSECHPEIAKFRAKLYEREVIPHYKTGDLLLYRQDIWHRGTPVKLGQIRTVLNLAWRRSDCFWYSTWNAGFTKKMYYGPIEKLFVSMSPAQRATVGVPAPGHAYWTERTVRLLKARYPDIDVKPYLDALRG